MTKERQKPASLMGVARSQVNSWLKGCSAPTQEALSGHELLVLRQMVQACMKIAREQPELK